VRQFPLAAQFDGHEIAAVFADVYLDRQTLARFPLLMWQDLRDDPHTHVQLGWSPSPREVANWQAVWIVRRAVLQLFVLRRGDYGYDAPWFPLLFGFLSMAAGLDATISWRQGMIRHAMRMTLYFVFFLANTSSFLYTTRRGKFLEWDRILDRLHLRGDEGVLDMGCGRGAVLTAVARRLTTGRVTGVDIWSKKDQSGNASDVTLRNASLEGVAGRVQIETGDMRALPHPDATFDLVVSSLAIHNIRSNADRKRAIVEGFRVLKPGGRIVIADIRTAIYEEALRALGASNVERRRLGWRFWWGNPFASTTLLSASKAPA
jgi:SAM-dependent methyltransferase